MHMGLLVWLSLKKSEDTCLQQQNNTLFLGLFTVLALCSSLLLPTLTCNLRNDEAMFALLQSFMFMSTSAAFTHVTSRHPFLGVDIRKHNWVVAQVLSTHFLYHLYLYARAARRLLVFSSLLKISCVLLLLCMPAWTVWQAPHTTLDVTGCIVVLVAAEFLSSVITVCASLTWNIAGMYERVLSI